MGLLRVQHTFQGISLQPEDRYVNVFYFQVDPTPGSTGLLAAAIKHFYEVTPTGVGQHLSHFLSGISGAPGASIKMYDMDDPIPRAPVHDELYDPPIHANSAVKNLPDEVALCLSYSAAPASGEPIARRRGRMYIGPFCDSANGGASQYVESQPSAVLMDCMVKAAGEMASIAAAAGYDWSVYSPTSHLAISITSVHVDNAWDTQRRRGNKPTSRVTQAIGT